MLTSLTPSVRRDSGPRYLITAMAMALDNLLYGKPQEAQAVCERDDAGNAVAVVTELLAQMLDAVAQLSQHPVETPDASPESSKRTAKGGGAAGDDSPSGASRTGAEDASSANAPSTAATCSQDAETSNSSRPGARPKPYIPWSQREIYERRRNGSVSSSVNTSAAWDRSRGNPARKSVSATGESLAAASGLPAAPRGNRRATGSPAIGTSATGPDSADEPHSTSRSGHTSSAPLGGTHSPGSGTKPAAVSGRDALRMAREQQHGPRPHPNFSPRSPSLTPPSTYTTATSPPPPSRSSPGPGSHHATLAHASPGGPTHRSPGNSRKAIQATSTACSHPGSARNSGSHAGRSGHVSGPAGEGTTVTAGAVAAGSREGAAAAGGRSRSGSGVTGGQQLGAGRSAGAKGGRASGSSSSGRSSGSGGQAAAAVNGVGGGEGGFGAGETGRGSAWRGGAEGSFPGRGGGEGDGEAAGAGNARGHGAEADVRDVEVEVVQQGSRGAGAGGGGTAAGTAAASPKGLAGAGAEGGKGAHRGPGGQGAGGEQRDAGVEGEGADGPTPACCKCAIM